MYIFVQINGKVGLAPKHMLREDKMGETPLYKFPLPEVPSFKLAKTLATEPGSAPKPESTPKSESALPKSESAPPEAQKFEQDQKNPPNVKEIVVSTNF